jgi:hypothetical protein
MRNRNSKAEPGHNPAQSDAIEKGGYQPLNEGYSPPGRRGYTPAADGPIVVPPLPTGGTAESPRSNGAKDEK